MAVVPLRGVIRRHDAQNPTLIPNLDIPVASGAGTLDVLSPAAFMAANPQTAALVTATIGGTVTTGDTITVTLTSTGAIFGLGVSNVDPSNKLTFAYTTIAGDTVTTVAEGLLNALEVASQSLPLYGEMGGEGLPAELKIYYPGPVGNTITATAAVTGSATETVTFSGSGVMSGGAGPIVPYANFVFGWRGVVNNYWYGIPRILSTDLVAAMVAAGAPI